MFPQNDDSWTIIEPINEVIYCVSRAITLVAVGEDVCDNPSSFDSCLSVPSKVKYLHVANSIGGRADGLRLVFTVVFVLRMVPAVMRPLLVWALPHKWRLRSGLEEIELFIVSRVKKLKAVKALDGASHPTPPNLLSWMVNDAKHELEEDPYVLTRFIIALAAGGTYNSANFIVSILPDLVTQPHFLQEIREEIKQRQGQINGNWYFKAFNNLHKLDSAFKETTRLACGSLTTYNQVMLSNYTLSNGIPLKKGQFICVSSHCRAQDGAVCAEANQYDALRSFNLNLRDHIAQPRFLVGG